MATVIKGNSITMTAASDASSGVIWVHGLTFQGTGCTPGERLRVVDGGSSGGSVVVDYVTMAAIDNADLWNGRDPKFYQGLFIADFPSGTCVLTFTPE